ncbi:MAG: hypothetical protein C0506_12440 [Anaerolinea sp.]|nr:hypothetical protein [Anaerolinea sp.]
MNTKTTKRSTPRHTMLGLFALLALIVSVGIFGSGVANAAITTVQVGQLNGGTTSGLQYNSADITVQAGDTVRFVRFAGSHDVTSAVVPGGATAFRQPASGNLVSGVNYDQVFTVAGVYVYYCSLHYANDAASDPSQPALTLANAGSMISGGQMVGRITVNAAALPDTGAPTVSNVAASPNPTNGATNVTLTASVADTGGGGTPTGVASARYRINGGASVPMTVSGGTSASATINVSAFALGVYDIEVQATDAVTPTPYNSTWVALAGGLTVSAMPVGAVQASVSVTGGNLASTAQNIAFPGVTLNGSDQTVTGTTTAWAASDARGTGDGWRVTVTSEAFVGSGGTIPVANFKTQLTAVTTVSGNTAPIPSPASFTPLSSITPVKLLSAALTTGMGSYTYTPAFQLTVPGSAGAGSYTANVTVSINSGP